MRTLLILVTFAVTLGACTNKNVPAEVSLQTGYAEIYLDIAKFDATTNRIEFVSDEYDKRIIFWRNSNSEFDIPFTVMTKNQKRAAIFFASLESVAKANNLSQEKAMSWWLANDVFTKNPLDSNSVIQPWGETLIGIGRCN